MPETNIMHGSRIQTTKGCQNAADKVHRQPVKLRNNDLKRYRRSMITLQSSHMKIHHECRDTNEAEISESWKRHEKLAIMANYLERM